MRHWRDFHLLRLGAAAALQGIPVAVCNLQLLLQYTWISPSLLAWSMVVLAAWSTYCVLLLRHEYQRQHLPPVRFIMSLFRVGNHRIAYVNPHCDPD